MLNWDCRVRNSLSLNIVGKQLLTNPLKYRYTSSISKPSRFSSKKGATTSFSPCLYHVFVFLQYSVNIFSMQSFSSFVRIKFLVRSTSVLITLQFSRSNSTLTKSTYSELSGDRYNFQIYNRFPASISVSIYIYKKLVISQILNLK